MSKITLNAESKVLFLNSASFDFIKAEQTGRFPLINIIAYTGGMLQLEGLEYPVVIDLTSTKLAPVVMLLWAHNREVILGEVKTAQVDMKSFTVPAVGVLSAQGKKADEVRQMMRDGQKFNVSAGTESNDMQLIPTGKAVVINGQTFTGPFYHAQDNLIREISLLAVGADSNAYAVLLAASFKGQTMFNTFEEFCAALGIDLAAMGETDKAIAQRIFDNLKVKMAEMEAAAKKNNPTNPTTPVTPVIDAEAVRTLLASATTDYRNAVVVERDRIDKINILSATYHNPFMLIAGSKVNIATHAIKENWTIDATENAMLKNSRPTTINAGGRNGTDSTPDRYMIIAAALCVAGKVAKPERFFTPQILDAAHKEYKGRIGLQQLLLEAAYINGYVGKPVIKGNLKTILKAAFSTIDIADVLTDNTNKFLVEGFNSVDPSWRLLSAVGSVSDFKEISGYRGVGSFRFERIAPDGHIPHGTISNEGYGNKADTYGKMLGITRQDIINDDLGVLTSVPRGLGRGGALALIHAFWTEFMDNSAFFAAGNNNVTTGALGLAGLATAVAKFGKQTDENGDYTFATPRYLVVPTELEPTAMDIYTQTNLVGGNTTTFGQNRYAGKYQPISSPYLSDSRFTGNSTTAYYLIADPNDIPVIEVVFLDGVESPTVETADVDFDQLGVQMRGFFDFGVRKQEPRGGVRSTGV